MIRQVVAWMRTYIGLIVMVGLVTRAPSVSAAQTPTAADALCTLLPDLGAAPKALIDAPPNFRWPICRGLYYPIPVPGQPDQHGIVVTITQFDSPAMAKSAVRMPGAKAANYGDGGLENPGDPSANDQTVMSRSGRTMISMEELTGQRASPEYQAVFSSGSTLVTVKAFPSKIATARKAVAELNAALHALVGGGAVAPQGGGTPPATFEIGGSACADEGQGATCMVSLSAIDAGKREVGYVWSVDGVLQAGATGNKLTIRSLTKGDHVIKVRAFDKNTNQPSNVLVIEFKK